MPSCASGTRSTTYDPFRRRRPTASFRCDAAESVLSLLQLPAMCPRPALMNVCGVRVCVATHAAADSRRRGGSTARRWLVADGIRGYSQQWERRDRVQCSFGHLPGGALGDSR